MKITIGADHGGFGLKTELISRLSPKFEFIDMGAYKLDNLDDYPDFALAVAQAVIGGKAEKGIIICGSGVGACIAANKVTGIRAGICHDTYSAHQGVEHDNMNVLCLGARVIGGELANEIVWAFLNARFTGEERHLRRLQKVLKIEKDSALGKS